MSENSLSFTADDLVDRLRDVIYANNAPDAGTVRTDDGAVRISVAALGTVGRLIEEAQDSTMRASSFARDWYNQLPENIRIELWDAAIYILYHSYYAEGNL